MKRRFVSETGQLVRPVESELDACIQSWRVHQQNARHCAKQEVCDHPLQYQKDIISNATLSGLLLERYKLISTCKKPPAQPAKSTRSMIDKVVPTMPKKKQKLCLMNQYIYALYDLHVALPVCKVPCRNPVHRRIPQPRDEWEVPIRFDVCACVCARARAMR